MTTEEQQELPRGIRIFTIAGRALSHACQWRLDGKRKTKFFATVKARDKWAWGLVGDTEVIGTAAFRLSPDEARAWRAFRQAVGDDTSLDAIANCWAKHGKPRAAVTVRDAVDQFLAAKTNKGLGEATVKHYKTVLSHLTAALGNHDIRAVAPEELGAWIKKLEKDYEPWTIKTHYKRMAELFAWLKARRLVDDNPCDGFETPLVPEADVALLPLQQTRDLFEKNEGYRVIGRMALEAFGFLRASSAGRMKKEGINLARRGVRMPGPEHKSRKTKFRQGHPDNLWAWLGRIPDDCWEMTERQYREEKRLAFVRAGIREGSDNRLKKNCITAHLSWLKNPPLTRRLAQHTDETTTEIYEGVMDEHDAEWHFLIYPTGASSPVPAALLAKVQARAALGAGSAAAV